MISGQERGVTLVALRFLFYFFDSTPHGNKSKYFYKELKIMNDIKVSLDYIRFKSKPKGSDIACISDRIADQTYSINRNNIKSFVELIAGDGRTFCPATFFNGKKNKENFEQVQLFVLDFDGNISFKEVKNRAERYDLPILFVYETFTSKNKDKFRVVFLNDAPIPSIKAAEMMLKALTTIFPEADPQGKSAVQMYFGSNKGLRYFDESLPKINIESLLRNTSICLEDRYGVKHYKRHLEKFYQDTGVALNEKKQPDISVVDDSAECVGANVGKNLPNPTIILVPFGRKFPNRYYRINFGENRTSVLSEKKKSNYHRSFRSSDLGAIRSCCQLFREFEIGSRRLEHMELFGLATNLIHVETAVALFKEMLKKHSYYDDKPDRYRKWDQDLWHIRGYKPYNCSELCPYSNSCSHGTNILSTSKPKYQQIEQLCRYYFGADNIDFSECKKARYEGTLNQYYDKSMSRACIDKNTSIINRIKKWSGLTHTISFKKYQKGDLHFGNTAGCDHLKGKNIDVIGTPHQTEWIYKLFANSIGLDFDAYARIKPNITAGHNGYRFRFTTYDDKILRAIQFYMIESELEQAVGRARLLRENCTVNLFSNFPLSQANLLKSEYDDENDKEIEFLEPQPA